MSDDEIWDRLFAVFCPECGRNHILDNGRVWGFCGLRTLIRDRWGDAVSGAFTEQEIKQAIESRFPVEAGGDA